jgi:hypothetical protein
MGILDEAIREHLDLKRRRGADAGELQQLEDEAFGPPTRPGEPDFPDRAEDGAEGEAAEVAEAETAFMPADEAVAVADEGIADEPEAGAPATDEHAEAAVEEPLPEEPAAEEPVDETMFFDHASGSQELELPDLELELDDELDQELGERSLDQPPAEELPLEPDEAAAADEPPIETFDTVEHHFEEAIEEEPPSDQLEPPSEEHPAGAVEAEGEEEDADVLEETPEFLRERPEDDELWFEQGEPKDFDF